MNRLLTLLFVSSVFCTTSVYAQNVGVGTSSPDNSAKLHVSSTDGGLLIPRMTEVQRDSIAFPATGLMIFQTDGIAGFYYYDGSAWTAIGSGSGTQGPAGASAYQVAVNNGFVGTEADWLNSLVGADGADGATGAQGPAGPAASGNTLDEAYDQGGAGAGRTINATDGAVVVDGGDGFMVSGTVGSGPLVGAPNGISDGAGTRMFFNPNRAAFRAGHVNGTEWDAPNIGSYSVAFGYNNIASGSWSAVIGGGGNTASGFHSTATGNGNTAAGDYSFVAGNGNTTGPGFYAIALGSVNSASGQWATAIGGNNVASGMGSTALGLYHTAPSLGETAIGLFSTTYTATSPTSWDATDRLLVVGNGQNPSARSDAMVILKSGNTTINGELTLSDGTSSITLPNTDGSSGQVLATDGAGNVSWTSASAGPAGPAGPQGPAGPAGADGADGGTLILEEISYTPPIVGATRTGYRIVGRDPALYNPIGDEAMDFSKAISAYGTSGAAGANSLAFGGGSKSGGQYSLAGGRRTNANGNSSFAMGAETSATGNQAVAIGFQTTASNRQTFASGTGSTASARYSTAMGENTIARSRSEFVVGMNNTDTAQAQPDNFISSNQLFVVGNGQTAFSKSDALVVYKSGNTRINGELTLSDGTSSITLPNTDGSSGQVLATDGAGNVSWSSVSGGSSLWTQGTGSTIYTLDNVAIGTSAAAYSLNVSGDASFQNGRLRLGGSGITNPGTAMTLTLNGSSTGTGNQSYINLDNNHILRIQDASSNVLMFLHSAGLIALDADNTADVAIGSLSATEKLDVNGKIRMRTGATAGYVPVADAAGVMTWTDPSTLSTDGTGALEEITDGANTGYRIVGRDPALYLSIGDNAVDLSTSTASSSTSGASGTSSTAMGTNTTASNASSTAMGSRSTASGFASTAMGYLTTASASATTAMGSATTASGLRAFATGLETTASGVQSTAMGHNTTAPSYGEMAIGTYNTNYTPADATLWAANDRLFVIGNGTSGTSRSDAMIVYKNGDADLFGNVGLNDGQLRFRGINDPNHYLAYLGGAFDGPKLNGNRSVVLSTNQDSRGVRVFGEGAGGTQLVVNANYDLLNLPPSESGLIVGAYGGSEGGQIQLNASQNGVAYMLDVEGSNLRILNGTDAGSTGLTGVFQQNGTYNASDLRLKTVVNRSDAAQDLALLNQIQITDYTLNGDESGKVIKKVIAQELRKVFPNAVCVTNGLIDGEKISDFHLVDYDAISMLNVSATQELYRMIQELQAEIDRLNTLIND